MVKSAKTVSLIVLTTLLLLAAVNFAQAQSQATVIILDTVGGTTDPAPGTYPYNDGTSVTITPTPTLPGFTFSYWIISSDAGSRVSFDNPITFPVSAGAKYTVQPIFQVIQPIGVTTLPVNLSTAAIIDILPSAGGVTTPRSGTYALANATSFNLTAIPSSGWTFSHWVISGNTTNVSHGNAPLNLEPTDNPYNVNHGYGSRFVYQAVFTQTSSSPTPTSTSQSPTPTATSPSPSPTIPELSALALGILLLAMIPVVIVASKRKLLLK